MPGDLTTATDEAKAKRRMEIEAKLSDLRLQQAKETEQKAAYFGEHAGITCDGCGVAIIGYRYKCKDCSNHDVCENCFDAHQSGRVNNSLGKQVISNKVEDHRFALHKDKGFTPLVKKAPSDSAITNLNPHHLTRRPPS